MEDSTFLSKWLRSRHIKRWPLQLNLIQNDNAQHSFECSVIAHMIGVIENELFDGDVDPNRMAAMAIFHEADEVGGLGDINKVAKNNDDETTVAFARISEIFQDKLLESMPEGKLRDYYLPYIKQKKGTIESDLIKCSDDISAFIEASKEIALGNLEYNDAITSIRTILSGWCEKYRSVDYFCINFLPAINHTIDKDFK